MILRQITSFLTKTPGCWGEPQSGPTGHLALCRSFSFTGLQCLPPRNTAPGSTSMLAQWLQYSYFFLPAIYLHPLPVELFINCREQPQPDSQSALSFVLKDGDPEQASCRRMARKTDERFQDDASQREERGRRGSGHSSRVAKSTAG